MKIFFASLSPPPPQPHPSTTCIVRRYSSRGRAALCGSSFAAEQQDLFLFARPRSHNDDKIPRKILRALKQTQIVGYQSTSDAPPLSIIILVHLSDSQALRVINNNGMGPQNSNDTTPEDMYPVQETTTSEWTAVIISMRCVRNERRRKHKTINQRSVDRRIAETREIYQTHLSR